MQILKTLNSKCLLMELNMEVGMLLVVSAVLFSSSLLSLLFVVSRKEFKNDRIHLSVIYRVNEVKVAQTSMSEL